ncbi:sigma-70 family RNA polymerase sigma factor [Nannocystis sp. SCPEA4]|uniref:RNA polymerase sigma factor n=1 Tax=Nannocystis sp. SCPEA4 TaxID=2996787 RepID=UPI00226EC453|nr:sigma-70 family RNA polymerase sigma factor [Nannocystis sp. SCPEA4]MCY1062097.1 sigma-70 family RNA polymerase sigma factor [Nannocystis sp. SCPEA4]
MSWNKLCDEEILQAWRQGDKFAGNALIRRYITPLRRYFTRRFFEHADDLVQRTLLACIEQRDKFRGESTFRGYVFRIAHNVLMDELRRFARTPSPLSIGLDELPSDRMAQCDRLIQAERRGEVARAVRTLAPEYRSVVELSLTEDLSCRELAKVLRINEHTARSRLSRGRDALRGAFLAVNRPDVAVRPTHPTRCACSSCTGRA